MRTNRLWLAFLCALLLGLAVTPAHACPTSRGRLVREAEGDEGQDRRGKREMEGTRTPLKRVRQDHSRRHQVRFGVESSWSGWVIR